MMKLIKRLRNLKMSTNKLTKFYLKDIKVLKIIHCASKKEEVLILRRNNETIS